MFGIVLSRALKLVLACEMLRLSFASLSLVMHLSGDKAVQFHEAEICQRHCNIQAGRTLLCKACEAWQGRPGLLLEMHKLPSGSENQKDCPVRMQTYTFGNRSISKV